MPASRLRDAVEREDHLPVLDAGEPRRLLVVADGIEQAAKAGAAQREDDQRRERHEQEQRVGKPQVSPVPSQIRQSGHIEAGGDDGALVDLQAAEGDEAGAERHDQRMHAEDADADAVDEADQQRRHHARSAIATAGSWSTTWCRG